MTKEEAIIRMQENFSSFHNDFIDGKLEFSDISEEEKEKFDLLTNLSYLFPCISLSILLKDILGSAEVLEHFITDREQKENFQEEKKNFMSLISEQEFFKEKFIDVLFYKDEISKLEKENKELNHRNKELELRLVRLEIIELLKTQEVEKAKQRKSEKSDDSCTINGHEYVDLGLPSGLKWATCNVGANSPEEYGDYFAWGETTIKSEYNHSNSKTYGMRMADIKGDTQYDAARAQWGGGWRLPTIEDFNELKENCKWKWTNVHGVKGMRVVGHNGNSIFFPAAGYRFGSSLNVDGDYGYYWSSTPKDYDNGSYAYYLNFYNGDEYVGWCNTRSVGLTVRPITE